MQAAESAAGGTENQIFTTETRRHGERTEVWISPLFGDSGDFRLHRHAASLDHTSVRAQALVR